MYYKEQYFNLIRKDLILNRKNHLNVPKIQHITLNVGFKNTSEERLLLILLFIELCTGQIPTITRAKKAISNFELKKNDINGCKVKLKDQQLYIFIFKFLTMSLPLINSFSGFLEKSFDKNGNLTIGIKDVSIYPELNDLFELFDINYGMDISISTSAKTASEAKNLISGLNLPIKKRKNSQNKK